MARVVFIIAFFVFLGMSSAFAQNVIYTNYHKEDDRNTPFEILGKIGPNYLIYKNVHSWRHVIQVFDVNMEELSNNRLDFISEKTSKVDFITYPDRFNMVYQYQKNNILYCNAVVIDAAGKKIAEPVTLDTTRINFIGNTNIYYTTYSEDKSKILVYKVLFKYSRITVVTKLYDNNFKLLDSTRRHLTFNERKEIYTDYQVDNDGNIIYAKETNTGFRENIDLLEVVTHAPGGGFNTRIIPLEKNYIDEFKIKIDNLNKTYLFNSFYYHDRIGSVQGLFAGMADWKFNTIKTVFNPFPDSLRSTITKGEYRFAFNDFSLNNIFVKRDGSYIIAAEDNTTISRANNNPWNRWDNFYNYGNTPGNYYYGNSNYNNPYYKDNRFNNSVRYIYKNILIASIDTSLKIRWSNIILKDQSDEDKDSFLSYGTLNTGNEIHFLFLNKERNSQIISNQSISSAGLITRYPTLKSREAGYDFLPRLSKQVGPRQIIMPSIYRGYLVFTKIEF